MPANSIDIVFLGSGNAFAYGRDWSSVLLNGRILFDASPTVLPRLRELKISPGDIETIFISHLHADHIFGLPFLMLDHYYITDRDGPLTIIGPKGLEEFVESLWMLAYPKLDVERKKRLEIIYIEAEPGRDYSTGGVEFSTYEMVHGRTQDIAYRLSVSGAIVCYSGDTGPNENLDRLVEGASVAVVEMSSSGQEIPGHMTPKEIIRLRGLMPPQSHLVITHLPPLDNEVRELLLHAETGLIEIAEDLQRFTFVV